VLAMALAGCGRRHEAHLTVAAAADLQFALNEIAEEFRASHPGVDLRVVYGSSGNFYTQIQNGAPFDLFLSADVEYAKRLAARSDAVFQYAVGRIVVWVPPGSRLDPAAALRDPELRHLAIANPEHAPYGRAAVAALQSMGLYDVLKLKLVLGENIAQTFQFAQTGAADAGIVALSLVMAPQARGEGRYWEIPQSSYSPLEQGGVLLHDTTAAREFRDALLSPGGRRTLARYGFSTAVAP
jgi:molybdate transport system substrate-binding protein